MASLRFLWTLTLTLEKAIANVLQLGHRLHGVLRKDRPMESMDIASFTRSVLLLMKQTEEWKVFTT